VAAAHGARVPRVPATVYPVPVLSVKKVEEENQCLEQCLEGEFSSPRPKYALFANWVNDGENCQVWADRALAQCRRICTATFTNQIPVYHQTPVGF